MAHFTVLLVQSLSPGLGRWTSGLLTFFTMLCGSTSLSLTADLDAVNVPPDSYVPLPLQQSQLDFHLVREHPSWPHVATMHERQNCLGVSILLPTLEWSAEEPLSLIYTNRYRV